MKGIKSYIISGILLVFFLTGCKPTEKGYQAAYDAAKNKREAAKADMNPNVAVSEFQEVDGAQAKEINGVKVYLLSERISPAESGETLSGSYNVAIGKYKMITNCRSQVSALRNEGYNACAVKNADGMYYTVAGSFATLDEAVAFVAELKKDPNRVYVGLNGNPLIIRN